MRRLLEDGPEALARFLRERARRRAFFVRRPDRSGLLPSEPELEELAAALAAEADYRDHEGIFLEVGRESGVLFGAFVHDTRRGQAQGGLRYWPYARLGDFLRDGLRLSSGMTRKNALAGLWWGGGKGLITAPAGESARDPAFRNTVFREYGAFLASLRGVYVTAEDVGITPEDLVEVFRTARFVTCIPPEMGGSGNPSAYTAVGVVRAMEAAFDFLGMGGLHGKRVAMQGAGNVGDAMIEPLLAAGTAHVRVAELSAERRHALLDRYAGRAVEVVAAKPGDHQILAEPCDVLAPNALGGVLGPKTIPSIRAHVVCGAANNQLEDEARDGAALAGRGITFVPDVICSRMGIVHCANEQYGTIPSDPAVERHLSRDWDSGIYAVTRRVLERARGEGIPPAEAANRLADQLAAQPHPIWGHRTQALLGSLVTDRWHERG